ncbi:MAG: hypothetical protein FWC00_00055 [Firmicutes bacterium]|nr:hypothetical protein [Bacillota bacterium]
MPIISNTSELLCRPCCGCPPESCQCDFSELEERLDKLEAQIEIIGRSVEISDVRTVMSSNPNMSGLGTSVISIGPTYNYWGEGALSVGHQWANGTTYYLSTVADFPELAFYQGQPTIGTVWFTASGGIQSMPIYVDSTGIYIKPTNNLNATSGTTFKFTLTLILTNAML